MMFVFVKTSRCSTQSSPPPRLSRHLYLMITIRLLLQRIHSRGGDTPTPWPGARVEVPGPDLTSGWREPSVGGAGPARGDGAPCSAEYCAGKLQNGPRRSSYQLSSSSTLDWDIERIFLGHPKTTQVSSGGQRSNKLKYFRLRLSDSE